MQTRHLTIMLTDIKGFTSKTASFSRTQVFEMIEKHKQLVLPVVQKFKGALIKTIGDAFLVTFDSPTDAVLCGVAIQDVLKAHNADRNSDDRIEIRIAINSGEVTLTDSDVYGDAVNITARIESIAEAGEVFFTEAVYLSMNKKEVPSSEIGYRQFKNVPEKIKVYRVLRETPIGRRDPLAAEPVYSEGPRPEPAFAAASGTAARAGFWRKLAALLIDIGILAMIVNMLLPVVHAPRAGFKHKSGLVHGVSNAKSINISPDGVQIRGENGEVDFENYQGRGTRRIPVKLLLWTLYCGIFLWRFAATPGMKILKLKIVDFSSGGPIGADRAFLRAFFSLVSLGAALLGYLWAIWEQDKRTWHDIIAGTRIVRI